MKILLATITALFLLTNTAAADLCADWPRCEPTTKKFENQEKPSKQAKTSQRKKERIPIVDDVVDGADLLFNDIGKAAKAAAKEIDKGLQGIQNGLASYYWQPQGVACSNGRFNPEALTAAHKTLPCGTRVRVTNQRNGKSVVVTINDRGPYVKNRVIDLSRAAARAISMEKAGVVPVTVSK